MRPFAYPWLQLQQLLVLLPGVLHWNGKQGRRDERTLSLQLSGPGSANIPTWWWSLLLHSLSPSLSIPLSLLPSARWADNSALGCRTSTRTRTRTLGARSEVGTKLRESFCLSTTTTAKTFKSKDDASTPAADVSTTRRLVFNGNKVREADPGSLVSSPIAEERHFVSLRLASSRAAPPAPDMPERISISDFVVLTNEDLSSPGTSSFQSKMSDCRSTVCTVEEVRVAGGRHTDTQQTH